MTKATKSRGKKNMLYVLAALVIGTILFFGFFMITEYKPEPIEDAQLFTHEQATKKIVKKNQAIKIVTWNLGYGSLDANADFFLDGGKGVFPPNYETVLKNIDTGIEVLKEQKPEIILLQEVDEKAKRTFSFDQKAYIVDKLNRQSATYAYNIDTIYVPYPFPNMTGNIRSGILTLSDYEINKGAQRHQLPGSFPWPKSLVYLKRCLTLNAIDVADSDKKLYVINLHLSAYDKQGKVRLLEMQYLKDLANKLYAEGNWVIAGGDWNANFPGVSEHIEALIKPKVSAEDWALWNSWIVSIDKNYMDKGWNWVFDINKPSVRSLKAPYVKDKTLTTIIDGFLVSPNVKVNSVDTYDIGFKNSDHQAVFSEIELQ